MDQKLSMTAFLDFLIVIVMVAMTVITNCHIDSRFDKLEKALVEMQSNQILLVNKSLGFDIMNM